MRDLILLSCEQCKRKNYSTTKNKKTISGKFSIKKFCRFCGTHILHKETKP